VANNEFDPTGGYGIVSNERTRQALITYDRFEDHNGGAILFTDAGAGTADVAVTANTALDNTRWDCQDESTGVQNAWTANLGRTSSPADLCAPPPPPTDKPGHGKGRHHKEYKEYKKNKQQDPCVCTRHHPRAV
jgi:hypothetical protein